MDHVEKVCEAIRLSFSEAEMAYTCGSCYKFYQILKEIYGEAEPLINSSGQHVISKIGENCYDIRGRVRDTSDFGQMNQEQIDYFENRVFSFENPQFYVPGWYVDEELYGHAREHLKRIADHMGYDIIEKPRSEP